MENNPTRITVKSSLGTQSWDVTDFIKKALAATTTKGKIQFSLAGYKKGCLSAFDSAEKGATGPKLKIHAASHSFETCIQDCGKTGSGVEGNRVCDDKQKGVKDPRECPKWCKSMNYKRFMLACPQSSTTECWCCNHIDKANGGKEHEKLRTSECTGGKMTSGLTNNKNGHCSGMPKGTFEKHGYYLGGKCRGALYKTGL
jgi:hypothetical protein